MKCDSLGVWLTFVKENHPRWRRTHNSDQRVTSYVSYRVLFLFLRTWLELFMRFCPASVVSPILKNIPTYLSFLLPGCKLWEDRNMFVLFPIVSPVPSTWWTLTYSMNEWLKHRLWSWLSCSFYESRKSVAEVKLLKCPFSLIPI